MITQPEPEEKRKERKKKKKSRTEYSSRVVCALCVFLCFFFSHPEKPESGIETTAEVVGRSDIKPRYHEVAQAFELDFDFVNK